jgi:TolA-binding protein
MTVVGLHPEELFDKLLDGQLTSVERERLRQHLDGCALCRFEYAARLDFEREAMTLASSAPPLTPLRPPQLVRPAPRRRRRPLVIWGLAAAALISASGALASVLTGKPVWHAVSVLVSRPPPPVQVGERGVLLRARPNAQAAPVADAPSLVVEAAPSLTASEPVGQVAHEARPRTRAGSPVVKVTARLSEAAPKAQAAVDTTERVAKEPAPAAELFSAANQARRAGDVGRAAGLYHLLQDQYPGSAEAELSRVTLALLLLDSGDARGALTGFERYLAGWSHGLEAEALVGRARALGRLGRRDLEVAAWHEVLRKYPRSIYGRQASERLLALGQH